MANTIEFLVLSSPKFQNFNWIAQFSIDTIFYPFWDPIFSDFFTIVFSMTNHFLKNGNHGLILRYFFYVITEFHLDRTINHWKNAIFRDPSWLLTPDGLRKLHISIIYCLIDLKLWIPIEEKTGILMVTSDLRFVYWLLRKTLPNNRLNHDWGDGWKNSPLNLTNRYNFMIFGCSIKKAV
jgi:hypothetical protein